MQITAKFNSFCPICETEIKAGEKCEWEKGEKARHIECPSISYEIRLQYMFSNGSWVDCDDRTDEFLQRCIENRQRINGKWTTLNKRQVIDALKKGAKLRNAPDEWYSVCRCGNTHDRKIRNRRSQQRHKTGVEKQGQLWEPCKCGNEPVYMPLMRCDSCWPKN